MPTLWQSVIGQLHTFGGQRAVDAVVALVILAVVMTITWIIWRRRSLTQES
jgi:hypothetical protein